MSAQRHFTPQSEHGSAHGHTGLTALLGIAPRPFGRGLDLIKIFLLLAASTSAQVVVDRVVRRARPAPSSRPHAGLATPPASYFHAVRNT
jgi:hypothetical protein